MDNILIMRKLYFYQESPQQHPELVMGGVGVGELMPPSIIQRPQGMEYYLLVVFHDPLQVKSDGQTHQLKGGETFLWKPLQPHSFGQRNTNWLHSWLMISGQKAEMIISEEWNKYQAGPLHLNPNQTIIPTLEAIYDELLRYTLPDNTILESYLRIMLRKMRREFSSPKPTRMFPKPFLELNRYIEEKMHLPIQISDMARTVHLSTSHFCTAFKKHYGTTPMRYLTEQRLSRALILLEDQSMTIKEIACKVGYDDPLYFSRLFRKYSGKSPKQHREKS